MSCSPYDLRDYFFGELAAGESREMQAHLEGCALCRSELDRLRLTQAALRLLPEEEVPRRIALVSDKVFEPRWFERLWPAPRWGFASALVLALAIAFHAAWRPAPPAPAVDSAVMEARVRAEVARHIQPAVAAAVEEADVRQQRRTAELVKAAREQVELQRRADRAWFAETLEVLQKRYGVWVTASADLGQRP